MDQEPQDSLQIRCPNCSQRFKVGAELRDRMVECGACEHRFYIREDVIVRMRKFYPGERPRRGLERFHRAPIRHAASLPEGIAAPAMFQQAAPAPPPGAFEPVGPQRIIAGVFGSGAMCLMGLLLMFGGSRGGVLDGMETSNRVLMAAFTCLLGLALLLYANPRTRVKALVFGGLIAVGVVSLPFFFTEGSVPPTAVEGQTARAEEVPADDLPADDPLDAVRDRIGTGPLEEEARRLADAGSRYHAYGLSLIDLRASNRLVVRDFLFRVSGADASSHMYPREQGSYLMVLTGLDMTLAELSEVASPLGEVVGIFTELGIVEIKVNNDVFIEGPLDRLNDRSDPSFYELNLRELQSIELPRVHRAVQRLAEAEPTVYRADITRRLRQLLNESGVDFHGVVARALRIWDEDAEGASQEAVEAVKRLHAGGQQVTPDLVSLAAASRSSEMAPILKELWESNATTWESLCIALGPAMEGPMLEAFATASASSRHSAARILSRVGSDRSAAVLEAARDSADAELRAIIDRALETLRSR